MNACYDNFIVEWLLNTPGGLVVLVAAWFVGCWCGMAMDDLRQWVVSQFDSVARASGSRFCGLTFIQPPASIVGMERKDWTLVVIAAANGAPVQPVQLQKCLFLISRNLDLAPGEKYAFDAYDYGPFSKAIYSDASELAEAGMIAIRPDGTSREYCATSMGLEAAERFRLEMRPTYRNYLDEVVSWARGLSFKQLVRAIYDAYPEMKANSVFRY